MFKKRKLASTNRRSPAIRDVQPAQETLESSLAPATSESLRPDTKLMPLRKLKHNVTAVGVDLSEAALPERPESPKDLAFSDSEKPRKRFAPVKTRTTIKTTVSVDYEPNICKEWKQRGYCGFGDSCKFLHIREDFVSSARMELDEKKAKVEAAAKNPSPQSAVKAKDAAQPSHDSLCGVCNKPCRNAVETACHHRFCEACFLSKVATSTLCQKCNRDTDGAATAVVDIDQV